MQQEVPQEVAAGDEVQMAQKQLGASTTIHTQETDLKVLMGLADPSAPPPVAPAGMSTALVPVSSASSALLPRRHKRARADEILVKVRIADSVLVARVDDMAVDGLFARTQKVIPVGAVVEMGLLRAGCDELPLGGVVVRDPNGRPGLAVRFGPMSPAVAAEVQRVVAEQQARRANGESDVDPTKQMKVPGEELSVRDRELDELRRRLAQLSAENEQLRRDVKSGEEAQRRLRAELERTDSLSTAPSGLAGAADPSLLANLKRDAELAWTTIARLSDTIEKLK